VSDHRGTKPKQRRSYRPVVEALEALRLLSGTVPSLVGASAHFDTAQGVATPIPDLANPQTAWDEALSDAHVAEVLGTLRSIPTGSVSAADTLTPLPIAQPSDVAAGLGQLNKYLGKAWYRAGIAPQLHDDATQAVYVTLLQNLGRTRFDQLAGEIGQFGIRDVLSRETADGPDFFRAIDTVKKRAQREKSFQPLDTIDVSTTNGEDARALWRGALQEAIETSLTPREASLVYDTLQGKTPSEIATDWGVAPKTVSNEKTRVIQKLRDALVADLVD
jgi:DNA-binding CsgD family transcriptional regulator